MFWCSETKSFKAIIVVRDVFYNNFEISLSGLKIHQEKKNSTENTYRELKKKKKTTKITTPTTTNHHIITQQTNI